MPKQANVKYIYVLSQRYSGSTLLSFLLATHPAIATIGERRKFYNKSVKTNAFLHHKARHCSCGALFENCDYLNHVKDRVLAQIDPKVLQINTTEFSFSTNKYINRLAFESIRFCALHKIPLKYTPFANRTKALCHFNEVLARELLDYSNRTVFLDTSKIIDHAMFLSMIDSFDFHVIWLVRDPRAQVNSALKYNKWTLEKAVKLWKKEMVNNEKVLNGLNLKYATLRYEDLCKDPENEMKKVFRFAGLEDKHFSLDFRSKEQHIIGNASMRLGKDTTITERKDWMTQLSPEQIKAIEHLTSSYQHLYSES